MTDGARWRTAATGSPAVAGFPNGPSSAAQQICGALLALATVVSALAVFTPLAVHAPGAGLDESWQFGLNWALGHGLVFGRDIVFTFGPYAGIFTHRYDPSSDVLICWSAVYLGLSTGIVGVVLVSDGPLRYRAALAVAVICLTCSADARLMAYPVLAAAYGIQRIGAGTRSGWRRTFGLVALVVPFGLLDLVKGTELFLCALIVLAMTGQRLAARQWGEALAIIVAFLGAHLFFWLLAGQPVDALASYVVAIVPLVRGYTEAMSVDGPGGAGLEPVCFVLASAAVIGGALVSEKAPWRRGLSLVVVALPLFLSFKDALVRHDSGHAIQAPVALLLISTVALVLYRSTAAFAGYAAAICAAAFIGAHYAPATLAELAGDAGASAADAWRGLAMRLTDPAAAPRAYAAGLARVRATTAVPGGLVGPTDIYANGQVDLVAAADQWDPRPVFQGYSAYLPALLDANRRHLLGPDAPRNLVFDLASIDGRLPSLDDGASWPTILADYTPQTLSGGELVLTRTGAGAPTLTNLGAASHRLGERVSPPAHAGPLFVRLDIEPSLVGSLAQLAYKTSTLFITATLADGETPRYRIVAGMTKTGFLLSPLVTDGQDMALLYESPSDLSAKQVTSFVVDTDGRRDWRPDYRAQFFQQSVPPAQAVTRVVGLQTPTAAPSSSLATGQCDGNIEAMKATRLPPGRFSLTDVFHAQGWMAVSRGAGLVASRETLVVLTAADGARWILPTKPLDRADVAQVFKDPRLRSTGFAVEGDTSQFRGAYSVGLAYADGRRIALCPQFATPVVF